MKPVGLHHAPRDEISYHEDSINDVSKAASSSKNHCDAESAFQCHKLRIRSARSHETKSCKLKSRKPRQELIGLHATQIHERRVTPRASPRTLSANPEY